MTTFILLWIFFAVACFMEVDAKNWQEIVGIAVVGPLIGFLVFGPLAGILTVLVEGAK